MIDVLVHIRYQEDTGGGAGLSKVQRFAIAPVEGDNIEILPERDGGNISTWHERVVDRYLWTRDGERYGFDGPWIEVHVQPPTLRLTYHGGTPRPAGERAATIAELKEAGYR